MEPRFELGQDQNINKLSTITNTTPYILQNKLSTIINTTPRWPGLPNPPNPKLQKQPLKKITSTVKARLDIFSF